MVYIYTEKILNASSFKSTRQSSHLRNLVFSHLGNSPVISERFAKHFSPLLHLEIQFAVEFQPVHSLIEKSF